MRSNHRTNIEVVVEGGAGLGEAPWWDAASDSLIWVDIDAGLVHRLEPGTGSRSILEVGMAVALAVPRRDGGLVLAVRDGFALVGAGEPFGGVDVEVEAGDPATRMNDGACDSSGRLWAGTLSETRRPTAALYRWAGGDPERMLGGVTTSNGIGWSPGDDRMYYVDTATGRVDVLAYEAASGAVGDRRPLAVLDPRDGRPDGIAVDADGGVWVALWGGAALHRYTPAGRLDRRVALPVTQPTSCCFGGPALDTLFVTSAARGLSDPLAGAVLAFSPGCQGLPLHRFAG